MSKVIRDVELLAILSSIVTRRDPKSARVIDYEGLIRDLGEAACGHLGGTVVATSRDMKDGLGVCVHVAWDNRVPKGGGVWKTVDPDVADADWRAEAATRPVRKSKVAAGGSAPLAFVVIDRTDPNDLQVEFGGKVFQEKSQAAAARSELVSDPDFRESAHLFEVGAVHYVD